MKTKNKFSGPLITTLVLLSIFGLSKGVWYYFGQKNNNIEIQGLELTREAYVSSCLRYAMQSPNTTKELGTAYCGCIYDKGVQDYGLKKFQQIDAEASRTNSFSTEANEIINYCLVKLGE